MNKSIFKFSLDIHKPESQVLLDIKRLDASRELHISLTENGRPYQITSDCSAVFTAEKSDGNKICNDCRIEGNTIIYNITPQTVACIGVVACEIRLIDIYGGVITSPRFIILVNERIYNGEEIVESVIEADVLQSLLESRHSHKNKDIIDKITQEMLDMIGASTGGLTPEQLADLEANTQARHKHANKDFLDSFTKVKFGGTTAPVFKDQNGKEHDVWCSLHGSLVRNITKDPKTGDVTIDIISQFWPNPQVSTFTITGANKTKLSQFENDLDFSWFDDEINNIYDTMNLLNDDINARIDTVEFGISEIETMIDESGVLDE